MTLVELMVALVVMGAALAVAGVAWLGEADGGQRGFDGLDRVSGELRVEAFGSGAPATGGYADASGRHSVTVWPDGRVLVDSIANSLTGAIR